MGKHDNRRSAKMRQRVGQKKLKARLKRQKDARAAVRKGGAAAAPKAAPKKKPAAKAESAAKAE